MTRYAEIILDIINYAEDHLTAEDIYLKMKSMNEKIVLASVYNNLATLLSEGLIRKVSIAGSRDYYDRIQRHDHLVCSKCGRVKDIYLPDLTDMIRNQLNLDIDSYEIQVKYTCHECSKGDH